MTQAAERLLVQQASALLADLEARRHEPGLSADLLNLAVTCHTSMLAISANNRPAAVQLAIAGADLLQALRALGHSDAPLPDWVPIHEEQCCRYGAIWIHELLQQGHPVSARHGTRGIQLLQHLQELHPDPLPWIAILRRDLEEAFPSPTTAPPNGDLRLVVVGNCQAHPLTLGLRQALPQARLHASPSVHLATADDVTRLQRRLGDADLLVMHRVLPGYRDNIGLDSATLRNLLPPSARSVVLPNLHYEGHHPWIGYAQDPEGRLGELEGESPLGPYHDFLAMAAVRDNQPLEALLDPNPSEAQLEQLRDQHHQSLAELHTREADCDLSLSDWIGNHHRTRPVAHTINHPTQTALDQLLRRLLQHLGLAHQLGEGLFDATEHLGALSIPIHPWVRQALNLEPWADAWGQRQGTFFSAEQQLEESLSFYRRHPWIVAANAQHPKLKLAESLLAARPLAVGAGHTDTGAGPTLAALINYFNDEDMLAWQLKSGCLSDYDRIYIWDGPYGYLHQLSLFPDEAHRLDATPLGRELLADPRVVYCHRHWRDEAEKRIDAYEAVEEDLVLLHDTDEFFLLDRTRLQRFWSSPHAVASQLLQNLYAGGVHGTAASPPTQDLEGLPLCRRLFRRVAISPERHLDYLWLVGVQQQPTDESLIDPEPLGHNYHLTCCRSTTGQAAKMAFYKSLALAGQGPHPVVVRLRELVDAGQISLPQAQAVFLRGDPGYAGVPHPAFGLSLNARLHDPSFPESTLKAILADANVVAGGTYQLLSGYPLQLWVPASENQQQVALELQQPARLQLQTWLWRNGNPAKPETSLQCTGQRLELTLPSYGELLGRLITITVFNDTPRPTLLGLGVDISD